MTPPFDGFYFIDMDPTKRPTCKSCARGTETLKFTRGIPTRIWRRGFCRRSNFANFNRALCLLDPYGLQIDWEVLRLAGQSKAVDMFLNFPVMDMNRNAIWRNPGKVPRRRHGADDKDSGVKIMEASGLRR